MSISNWPMIDPAKLPPPELKLAFDLTLADLKQHIGAGKDTVQQRHVDGLRVMLRIVGREVTLWLLPRFRSPYAVDLQPWSEAMGPTGIPWTVEPCADGSGQFAFAFVIWHLPEQVTE